MAKSRKPKKRKHGGYVPADTGSDEKAIDALGELHHRLSEGEAASAGPVWGEVHQTLLKTKADKKFVMRIIGSRDADELNRLIDALKNGRTAPEESASQPSDSASTVDPEQTKHAMRAFRKRLKLTRLDDESRITVRPMTGGKASQIRAILPPHEYEREIWDDLIRQGQLRDAGQGFFELAEEHGG